MYMGNEMAKTHLRGIRFSAYNSQISSLAENGILIFPPHLSINRHTTHNHVV